MCLVFSLKKDASYWLRRSPKVYDGVHTVSRLFFPAPVGSDGARSRSARKAETRTGKAVELIQRGAKVAAGRA